MVPEQFWYFLNSEWCRSNLSGAGNFNVTCTSAGMQKKVFRALKCHVAYNGQIQMV